MGFGGLGFWVLGVYDCRALGSAGLGVWGFVLRDFVWVLSARRFLLGDDGH